MHHKIHTAYNLMKYTMANGARANYESLLHVEVANSNPSSDETLSASALSMENALLKHELKVVKGKVKPSILEPFYHNISLLPHHQESLSRMQSKALLAIKNALEAIHTIELLYRGNCHLQAAAEGSRRFLRLSVTSTSCESHDVVTMVTKGRDGAEPQHDDLAVIHDSHNESKSDDDGDKKIVQSKTYVLKAGQSQELYRVPSTTGCETNILKFQDLYPSALLNQRNSFQNLKQIYHSLKTNVLQQLATYKEDLLFNCRTLVDRISYLRQKSIETERKARAVRSLSQTSDSMSNILTEEKLRGVGNIIYNKDDESCGEIPNMNKRKDIFKSASYLSHSSRNFSGSILLRTFPNEECNKQPVAPIEVIWNFNFSALSKQKVGINKEPCLSQHRVCSEIFSYFDKLWMITCFQNKSSSPPITYDLKLVKLAKNTDAESFSTKASDISINQHLTSTQPCGGENIKLKCEYRLQGQLLGRKIIRKLYVDEVDTCDPIPLNDPCQDLFESECNVLFGPDEHKIEKSMLEKFLRFDSIIVSILLTTEKCT